jgi:hypothetical protein
MTFCNANKQFRNITLQLAIKGNEFGAFDNVAATHVHDSGRVLEPRDWPDCCDPAIPDSRGICFTCIKSNGLSSSKADRAITP